MIRFLFRRLTMSVATLLIIACLTFLLMNLVPGGPFLSEKAPSPEVLAAMEAKYGRESLLWMIEEIGEVIAIIKNKKEKEIMENQEIREKFVEEIADVYMY